MPTPYEPSHVTIALEEELLVQFRNRAKWTGLLTGLLGVVQSLEEDVYDLRTERLLSVATGAQLWQFARIVGEPQGALSEAQWRNFIQARILVNLCEGTPDEIIKILRIVAAPLTAGTDVVYQLLPPASYELTIFTDAPMSAALAVRVLDFMADVNPAGVGSQVVEADGASPFRFDSGPGFDVGKLAWIL